MKILLAFSLAILVPFSVSSAYDLTTRDGRTFKEIRLREKTDLGIRIVHESGVIWLDYSEIPVPDLWTFGFDQKAYDAAKAPQGGTKTMSVTAEAASQSSARPSRLYEYPTGLVSSTRTSSVPKGFGINQSTSVATAPAGSSSSNYNSPSTSGTSRGQCAATTKKGYRCSRMAGAGSSYCWQHP